MIMYLKPTVNILGVESKCKLRRLGWETTLLNTDVLKAQADEHETSKVRT